jgi:lipopolysaccharide heptosyltransferase I
LLLTLCVSVVTMTSMTTERSPTPLPNRILVVRLSAMGDVIHGMPAIAALRRAKPDLKIGWLIEARWAALLCPRETERMAPRSPLKPLADWVHLANFAGWRRALSSSETWREMNSYLHEVRGMGYELTLDLQGAIRSALASRATGARVRVGSSQPREAPATMFYTRAIDPTGAHVIEQALSIASAVAEQSLEYVDPPFPVDPAHEVWAEEFVAKLDGKPFAILSPGAGWGAKCWPAESFGVVARALADRGLAVVVNHGPREEQLSAAVRESSGGTAVPLKCSVGELIALTRRAALFVGGDTGPMHLAAALRVPVVALFGPTRPERNSPFGTRSVVLRSPDSVDNTSHIDRPDEGLVSIEPRLVIAAADQLLGGHDA